MTPKIITPDKINFEATVGTDVGTRYVTISTHLDPNLGRYVASELSLESPLQNITYENTSLAMRRLIAEGTRRELFEANPKLTKKYPLLKTWAEGRYSRPLNAKHALIPTKDLLDEAEVIMAMERLVGGFSIVTLARVMGLDYPTARRWSDKIRRRK